MSTPGSVTEAELAELVARMDEAAKAYIRGDVDRYLELFDHGDDYTLMRPDGGETVHGFVDTEEARAATRAFFTGGEATFDLDRSYASGDLAVLVGVERQHGEDGGHPDQDLSLRVTLVLRRAGGRWRIVHRHADPLVHGISLEQVAALAHG